eukprot:s913_g13.t1
MIRSCSGFAQSGHGFNRMSVQAGTGGIPLDSNTNDTLSALTNKEAHFEAVLIALRLVSSKAELLGNHQGLAEVVSTHLANKKPEVVAAAVRSLGSLGEVGARYADHVAAVIRWPNASVRLAAVETLGRFGRAAARRVGPADVLRGRLEEVMFDFGNLDDIDENAATPEWMKWRGVPQWQRAADECECILEDREETFAAPDMPQDPKTEDFAFLPVEVPPLPATAFDPLALTDETADAVEGNLSALNGQVIVNFATSAVEEFMIAKRERDEYKAYIDHLHQQRLQYLDTKKKDKIEKRGLQTKDKRGFYGFYGSYAVEDGYYAQSGPGTDLGQEKSDAPALDRKPFAWRELRRRLDGRDCAYGIAKDHPFVSTRRHRCHAAAFHADAHVGELGLAGEGQSLKTRPTCLIPRKHLAISDVFFPTGMVLSDAADIIGGKKEAPTLVHLVAMSVNKENGDLEGKHLLDNIKLPSPASYPSIKPRHASKLVKVASDPKLQDDDLKVAAVAALGKVGGDITQVPSVASLLSDKSPYVQGAACLTLTSLGPFAEEHAQSIAEKLQQDETRLAAATALAKLPAGSAKPFLKDIALCDVDPETREAAVEVLSKADVDYVLAE